MPALTRRRSKDDPHRETWLIYFGDVRVGVISRRAGVPNSAPQWAWSCGFYPSMAAGEHRSGIAETFEGARSGFQAAWQDLAPTRTEADHEAWRRQRDWTAWNDRMHDLALPLIVSALRVEQHAKFKQFANYNELIIQRDWGTHRVP
jgi:hypothetical protein